MNNFIGETHILKKSDDLIKYAGGLILKEIKAGQKITVIFPHRRPAYFLIKYLSDVYKAYKTSANLVEIFSIDDFIDKCYETGSSLPFPKISPTEASLVLFDLNRNEKTRIIKNTENLDAFMPWGYKLFGDFEELLIELAEPSSCDALIAEKINPAQNLSNFSDEFLKFSVMYRFFYKTLAERGLSSRSARYKIIAENGSPVLSVLSKKVILAGFYGITAAESVIFKNILKNKDFDVSVVSKTGALIGDFLKKLGLSHKEICDGNKPVKFYFNNTSSLHNEIVLLKESIKRAGGLSSRDLIVLPNEGYLFPLLHNVLNSLNKEDYNVSIGYSLKMTPLYSLFNLMSALHGRKKEGRFYAKDYISVLLHPYVKNISGKLSGLPSLDFDAAQTAELFRSIESYIKKNKILFVSAKKLENIEPVESAESDIKEYFSEINKLFISGFENIENISDFMEKILKIIDAVSNNSVAGKHPYGLKFIESAVAAITELKRIDTSVYKFEGITGYFNLLKNILKRQTVPFSGTPLKGLQVLGPLEARTVNFYRVFYLGANEGTVPDVSKENTLLTEDVRKFLKIPSAEESARIQEYNFFNLVSGAEEVHFFYNDSSSSEKSRFIEKIIWDIQKKTKNLKEPKENNSAFKINFTVKEPSVIQKTKEVKEYLRGMEYSASKLDTYIKCPSMFYYAYVLNLRQGEEMAEDMDAPAIGSIIHIVLKEYFKKFLNKEYKIYNLEDEKKDINKILNENFNVSGSEVFNLQKKQILFAINAFIETRWKDLMEAKITGAEYPLEAFIDVAEIHGETIPDNNINFKIKLAGRADLIIEKAGEHYIIDYKTGSSLSGPYKNFIPTLKNRDEWLEGVKSVQLPFYIVLYNYSSGVHYSGITSKLWGLKKSAEYTFELKNNLVFNSYLSFFRSLIAEIINLDYFSFIQKERDKKICGYCPYFILCGRI